MSRGSSRSSNLALANSEISIKTFVKETIKVPTPARNVDKYNLDFEGIQAKKVYDEIISQESKTKISPQLRSLKLGHKTACSTTKSAVRPTNNLNVLFKAIELGDTDFVYENFNADNVDITDQFGWTPLMTAACSGHAEMVAFLLHKGANTNIRDKSGLSAVNIALKRNHLEIVDLLKIHLQANKKNDSNSDEDDTKQNDRQTRESADLKGFFCEICASSFECTNKQHESSTVHIFNCKPKIPNIFYGISKQNKGYQMLLKKGWNEESGLGLNGKGQKYPVKTVLKRDRKGFSDSHRKFARVTHFDPNNTKAVRSVYKEKKNRKQLLNREAAKVPNDQMEMLNYLQRIEEKGVEIITDRQEIIALDKRRNDDRVGMRALQKQEVDKTWITVGPLLLKMGKKEAEDLLKEDQKQCDIEINKIRSDLRVKVNDLRDMEHNPPVPGLLLKPMSKSELTAMNQVLGKSL